MKSPFALAAVVVLAGTSAHASPLGMYGFGSRSTALGSAVSADVEDFSANYYNPAGLVRGTRLRLDLGYFYASHQLTTNGVDNHVDPARGLAGGLVAPGSLFGLRFAFGLAVELPDNQLSRSRSLPQNQPRWELYDNRVQILAISANLAIAPVPWLRIGGGMSFVSSTQGTLDIYGTIGYTNPSDTRLSHTVDADLLAVRYPQVGLQVDPMRNVTLSAVYRGQYQLALSLDATVNGTIVVGRASSPTATRIDGSYMLTSNSVAVFQPQQGVIGAAWRPLPTLTIMADVTWVNWSAYVNPTAQLGVSLNLQIPPGLTGFTAPTVPAPQQVVPASFHDTFVPRIGVEWRHDLGIHTLAARVGYRYDPTPVPDQTGVTNFLDSTRHGISAGLGFAMRGLDPLLHGGLTFDIHGDLQLLERRVVTKSDPTDPVGDYVLGGNVVSVGATMGVLF